jgi:hypothetical protein
MEVELKLKVLRPQAQCTFKTPTSATRRNGRLTCRLLSEPLHHAGLVAPRHPRQGLQDILMGCSNIFSQLRKDGRQAKTLTSSFLSPLDRPTSFERVGDYTSVQSRGLCEATNRLGYADAATDPHGLFFSRTLLPCSAQSLM